MWRRARRAGMTIGSGTRARPLPGFPDSPAGEATARREGLAAHSDGVDLSRVFLDQHCVERAGGGSQHDLSSHESRSGSFDVGIIGRSYKCLDGSDNGGIVSWKHGRENSSRSAVYHSVVEDVRTVRSDKLRGRSRRPYWATGRGRGRRAGGLQVLHVGEHPAEKKRGSNHDDREELEDTLHGQTSVDYRLRSINWSSSGARRACR